MTVSHKLDFPGTNTSRDHNDANYQNYLAWQAQQAERRRTSHTQFNMYQCRHYDRMVEHSLYKEEAERDFEVAKDMVERRLSRACDCADCFTRQRSNSDASNLTSPVSEPASPADSFRSDRNSRSPLTRRAAHSPPGTTIKDSTTPNSRNSLVVCSPPKSRHHQRRKQGVANISE